ncbi:hypothetical protein ACP70R_050274 [Stipagrostis hirtigluma subsp. patula]
MAPLAARNYATTYTHCSIASSTRRLRTCTWIRAATESGGDRRQSAASLAADGPRVVEVAASPAPAGGFGTPRDAELAMWDKLGAVVRLSYGIGIYAGMALTGRFICQMAGIDCTGGFHPSLTALVQGLGYASPPIMALLFILDDEVVKYSPHARAIRDVEDEELRSFFYGMSPWQFILVVTASSIGEELFYRAAVQGALADIFLRGTELMKDARGIASLSGMVPPLVPFAQTFAAAITAALTGSLYYIATAPKDPTYVVTPAMRSRTGRENLKKLFAVLVREEANEEDILPSSRRNLGFLPWLRMDPDRQHPGTDDHPWHILCCCAWPWALENPRPQEKVAAADSAG